MRTATLMLLAAAGLGIRLYGIGDPLVAFHPLRHYRSAILARACYVDAAPSLPDWARRVSRDMREMQPAAEPPVMEWLACAASRVEGREDVTAGRVLAAMAWVAAAWPVVLLTRRFTASGPAFVAAAIHLFLPYGILATRTFQPDALMTCASLYAVVAAASYFERRGLRRFTIAAALAAAAGLIKPMSVFVTVPLTIGLAFASRPLGAGFTSGASLVAAGLALPVLYYSYGALFGTLAHDQMNMRFVPSLLPTSFFWMGWLTQIRRVFGAGIFAVAVVTTAIARDRRARMVMAAGWAGYAAFAVAFTYHVPTHDYYHLPFVSVAAIGTALTVDRAIAALKATKVARATPGVLALAVCIWGAASAWPRLTIPDAREIVTRYERIGALTEHDSKVIFLDFEYGYPLMYHGWMSGDTWPNADDLAAEQIDGQPPVDAAERFSRGYAAFAPRYFVVTDLRSLAAQPDLQRLLDERARLVEGTPHYRVYRF